MAATVHPLPPSSRAGDARGVRLRHALRDGAVERLGAMARRMLDHADDALFRMIETATTDAERRTLLDTTRVLRLDRDGFLRAFATGIGSEFDSAGSAGDADGSTAVAFDYASLSLQPTDELEQRIAIGNIATRVENRYAQAAHALERRLDQARAQGLRIAARLFGAQAICTAFGKAVDGLRCEFDIKLIVFKLFERELCTDYGALLDWAAGLLDAHGIAGPAVQAVPAAGGGAASGSDDAPAVAPEVAVGGMATAASSTPWNPAAPWRDGAGAGWFDQLLAAPGLSTRSRIAFEALRLPLARAAAHDPSLGHDGEHPVRRRIADLIDLAAVAAGDGAAATGFHAALETTLGQATDTAMPTLDRLVRRLHEQLRDQRQQLLRQVRAEVARELELRSFGRPMTTPMRTLIRSGIAPLLALHLLNSGRDSDLFRDADALFDRLLATLDVEPPLKPEEHQARLALQADLRRALAAIGMSETRVQQLLDGLIRSWAEQALPAGDDPDASAHPAPVAPTPTLAWSTPIDAVIPLPPLAELDAAAAPAPPLPPAPLPDAAAGLVARLLVPESWFRVFDAERGQTRWLKLASHYPNEDGVTFAGFDESRRLSLRASRFVQDLIDGRSEPINPSAEVRAALDRLRETRPAAS